MAAHDQIQHASHSIAECRSRRAHVDFHAKLTRWGLVGHFWLEINSLAEVAERLSRSVKTVSSQDMTAMPKLEAKFN